MQRRSFIARLSALAALSTTPWLSACHPQKSLTLGIHPWIGYETLYLAEAFNWLPDSVSLRWGTSATESLAGLQSGACDAACLTLDETLLARARGIPLSVALVFNISAGADVVLARPDIRTLAALEGKRIGLEQGGVGVLVLTMLLQAARLPASAVTVVDLPPEQQLAAWQAGEVDALITYEPTATRLINAGARRLFDSRNMSETIFDVLAVRNDVAASRSEALEACVLAHFRALAHMQTHHQDTLYRIASHRQITPENVARAMAGVVQPSLAANQTYLSADDQRLRRAARMLSTMMTEHGILEREDTLERLITPVWLPRAQGG